MCLCICVLSTNCKNDWYLIDNVVQHRTWHEETYSIWAWLILNITQIKVIEKGLKQAVLIWMWMCPMGCSSAQSARWLRPSAQKLFSLINNHWCIHVFPQQSYRLLALSLPHVRLMVLRVRPKRVRERTMTLMFTYDKERDLITISAQFDSVQLIRSPCSLHVHEHEQALLTAL